MQRHYSARTVKGLVKAELEPKIVTVAREQVPSASDHISELHHGESTD